MLTLGEVERTEATAEALVQGPHTLESDVCVTAPHTIHSVHTRVQLYAGSAWVLNHPSLHSSLSFSLILARSLAFPCVPSRSLHVLTLGAAPPLALGHTGIVEYVPSVPPSDTPGCAYLHPRSVTT